MTASNRTGRVAGVLAVLFLLAVSGCARTSTPERSGPARSSPSTPQEPAAGEVPEILRFEFQALDGSTVDGPSLAGKDLALWSWAPW